MRGLDGLRGIAVIAVVLYHADRNYLKGGFLGVDIFFVLSGFLITTILMNEISQNGNLDRAKFYIRRIRRLFPALIALLLIAIVISGFFVSDSAYALRRDLPWALTFVLNLSYIFFNQSYFINIARPPLLQHLWSLAIEEQFYIIWPLVLVIVYRLAKRAYKVTVAVIALSLAITSTAWMAVLANRHQYPIPNDPSRLYFGTDTHAMGLLIGCALAAVVSIEKLNPKITPDRRAFMNMIGGGALVLLFAGLFLIDEFSSALYRGGFLAISLVTAIVILILAHPGLKFANLFSNRILVWFGDRSYGMYIWHWPIFMLLRPGIDLAAPDVITQLIRITILLVVSDISYRFLEMPIRQGALSRLRYRWKLGGIPRPNIVTGSLSAMLGLLLIISGVHVARAPVVSASNMSAFDGLTSIDEDPALALAGNDDPSIPKVQPILDIKPVVFGDSVVLGAHEKLKEVLGLISIDAKIGRQPAEIAERIEIRRAEKRLGDVVIIHMGTNGIVTENDLKPILDRLTDRERVIVVNVRVPRPWMKPTNEMISSIVPQYPNVRLADWSTASKGHRGYFVSDGVHLTKSGQQAFAELILQTMSQP
jgi:peptidoglycan/LPS O-acetylase OafA/YrhL